MEHISNLLNKLGTVEYEEERKRNPYSLMYAFSSFLWAISWTEFIASLMVFRKQ